MTSTFVILFHGHVVDLTLVSLICSKWQTKDQPVVVEEALAAAEDAVGVVPGGDQGEESPKTKMYAN